MVNDEKNSKEFYLTDMQTKTVLSMLQTYFEDNVLNNVMKPDMLVKVSLFELSYKTNEKDTGYWFKA